MRCPCAWTFLTHLRTGARLIAAADTALEHIEQGEPLRFPYLCQAPVISPNLPLN